MSLYLCHHGVKGQKWGIRRYQNPDGTLTEAGKKHYRDNDYVFEKGFKFETVYGGKNWDDFVNKTKANPSVTYVYDAENKHDKMVYQGAFTAYNLHRGAQYAGVKQYETVNELRSPSDIKRGEIFLEAYRNDPVTFSKGLNYASSVVKNAEKRGHNLSDLNKTVAKSPIFNKKTSDEDVMKYGYLAFLAGSEMNNKHLYNSYKQYYNKVRSKGYNAVIDDNNKGVYNDAQTPLIILNAVNDLKLTKVSALDFNIVKKNMEDVREYNYAKTGKRTIQL